VFTGAYLVEGRGVEDLTPSVSETNDLRKRMTVHRQHIRDSRVRMLQMSENINNCDGEEPEFLVFLFTKCKTDSILTRKHKRKDFHPNVST
jgi:hypothetical protein